MSQCSSDRNDKYLGCAVATREKTAVLVSMCYETLLTLCIELNAIIC